MKTEKLLSRQGGSGASPRNTLLVSDLRRGTSSDVLGMHFAQFGVVTRSEVLIDDISGNSKGCGRVEFQGEIPERVFAMEHRIEGRPCRVQRAVLLPRRPPRKKNSKPRTNPPSQSSQGAGPATWTEPPGAEVQAVPPRTPTALAAVAAAAVADLDQEQRRFQIEFSNRLSSLAGKR
jgi:RNA recognition motif-containing protein